MPSSLLDQLKALKIANKKSRKNIKQAKTIIINNIIRNNITNSKWQYTPYDGHSLNKIHREYDTIHISGFDTDEIKELFDMERNIISYFDKDIYDDNSTTISFIKEKNNYYRMFCLYDFAPHSNAIKNLNINISCSTDLLFKEYEDFLYLKNKFNNFINNFGFTTDKLENLYSLK